MTKDIHTFDVFVGCLALKVFIYYRVYITLYILQFIYYSSEEKQKGQVSYKRRTVDKYEDTKTTHFDINNAERCNSGLGIPPSQNRAVLTFRCGVLETNLPPK